jgi:hypothetical protein
VHAVLVSGPRAEDLVATSHDSQDLNKEVS